MNIHMDPNSVAVCAIVDPLVCMRLEHGMTVACLGAAMLDCQPPAAKRQRAQGLHKVHRDLYADSADCAAHVAAVTQQWHCRADKDSTMCTARFPHRMHSSTCILEVKPCSSSAGGCQLWCHPTLNPDVLTVSRGPRQQRRTYKSNSQKQLPQRESTNC